MAAPRILYEYPFNEGIRTMLRLEHLLGRLMVLVRREDAMDHHFALVTLFEIIEVASRADLKSDVLKELDRHRQQLESYRGHPGISEKALDQVISQLDVAHEALNRQQGKVGQSLLSNDWLNSVRSRIGIPGGTCSFDLPGYFSWQNASPAARQAELSEWIQDFAPLKNALDVLLNLLRGNGAPHRMHAPCGNFQHRIPEGRSYQLLRVGIDPSTGWIPEITGHRLMVNIRLMQTDADGKLKPCGVDGDFELTLCA